MRPRSDSGQPFPSDPPDAPADSGDHEIVAILDTIEVPVVVVGPDCILARINRAAAETFALAPTDIGRRLNTIAALADVKDIEQLCGQVIADDTATRRDVRSGDRRFLLRAAPYAIGTGRPEAKAACDQFAAIIEDLDCAYMHFDDAARYAQYVRKLADLAVALLKGGYELHLIYSDSPDKRVVSDLYAIIDAQLDRNQKLNIKIYNLSPIILIHSRT